MWHGMKNTFGISAYYKDDTFPTLLGVLHVLSKSTAWEPGIMHDWRSMLEHIIATV
jgi:hypothetical protein